MSIEEGHEQSISVPGMTVEWKRKRSSTYFMAVFLALSMNLSFTMLQTTLLAYLHTGLQLDDPDLYYGLNSGGAYLTILLFGVPLSTWFDYNRQLKICSIGMTLLHLFGNVIYMIPIKMCTVAGSVFMGINYVQLGIFISEIMRVYSSDEFQVRYCIMLVCSGIGDALGPLCAKLLESTNFWMLGIHITYGNSICLVMIGLSILRLILTTILVHDLSKEFDLKAVHQKEDSIKRGKSSYLEKMKRVLSVDTVLLLSHQAYSAFWTLLLPRLFPLIIQRLGYSNTVLDLCYVVAGVLLILLPVLLLTLKQFISMYFLGCVNLFTICFVQVAVYLISMKFSRPVTLFLLTLVAVCYGLIWITEMTYIVTTLGKFTPSSSQSSVEGTREIIRLLAALSGSLASAYIYENYVYVLCPSYVIVFLLLIGTCCRHQYLKDPNVVTPFEEQSLILKSEDEELE